MSETHETVAFKLGDDTIYADFFSASRPGPLMLNVHEDEPTSYEAGLANAREFGGRVVRLRHSGARLISFNLAGKTYVFDPNRIFSDAGIRGTLLKHSSYSESAHAAISAVAAAYLEHFTPEREPVIIALHNTVDGIFSVESFTPGEYLGQDAAAAYVSPRRRKFDFFYVTDLRFFDWLQSRDFNVVLQNNAAATDDGSLSVYFAGQGVPYINVEAELGHLDTQIAMLRAVREMLGA